MQKSDLMRTNLSDVERLALLVGSLSHDLDHRGTNNQFQIKYVPAPPQTASSFDSLYCQLIPSPPVAVLSIAIGSYVCLTVCHPLAYLKNQMSKPHRIFCTRYLWPLLGPPPATLCTSDFSMMSRFHILGPVGQNERRHSVWSSSPGGGTGR